eukprot:4125175-Pyramimonas_sp.AAC.1
MAEQANQPTYVQSGGVEVHPGEIYEQRARDDVITSVLFSQGASETHRKAMHGQWLDRCPFIWRSRHSLGNRHVVAISLVPRARSTTLVLFLKWTKSRAKSPTPEPPAN